MVYDQMVVHVVQVAHGGIPRTEIWNRFPHIVVDRFLGQGQRLT